MCFERERESYGTIDNLSFEKRQREKERLGVSNDLRGRGVN